MTYAATTADFRVEVMPHYLEEESKPSESFFAWSYTVTIRNLGSAPAQLLTRHWEITDGRGIRQVVEGPGVIGEQPVIPPQGFHRYSSWVWLHTPSGMMQGSYTMQSASKESFSIVIPAFSLDSPLVLALAN